MKIKILQMGAALALGSLLAGPAQSQDRGLIGPSPYEYTTASWIQPFGGEGISWGGNAGVHAQSSDRIFFLQRGQTELPDPVPPEYTNFPGSMGWNVLRGRGRIWQNCIYVVNSEGELLEVWDHWDHLFTGTNGPGPHRLRMSPYDPENRLWLIEESGHIIYVFSNDGEQLLMTLGEKNVPGNDETHYDQPQDVAFLPDGKFLIADGLGNKRIVVRNADGSYRSEFGEEGTEPHQYGSVHSIAVGPDDRLYVLDRNNRNVKVYQQTAAKDSAEYPAYEYVTTWGGLDTPLDISVGETHAWVTDNDPPKIVQFNLDDGSRNYTWLLPTEGQDYWIEMHSFSADEEGNLYGADNQTGRPQKMVPLPDANPEHVVARPYVPR